MIHYVIKGTQTISEYKNVRSEMEQRMIECAEAHHKACETWTHGEPTRVWYDSQGNICIDYEDGNYWHYRDVPDGKEWW